jgi:hypothetical protein
VGYCGGGAEPAGGVIGVSRYGKVGMLAQDQGATDGVGGQDFIFNRRCDQRRMPGDVVQTHG